MTRSVRIAIVEYLPFENFVQTASEIAEVEPDTVRKAVTVQAERVRRVLDLGASPIQLTGDTLLAEDVAGLVRVLPCLELEIAPKFLGSGWPGWREDFLLVANVARSGQLLIREGVASSTGPHDDLTALVARTLVDLFDRDRRRPLRTYRPRVVEEWSLDGEVDAQDILLPSADGYHIRQLAMTGTNRYNAQIARAATVLAPEVRDGVLQRQVRRVAQRLGPQPPHSSHPSRRVPSRHRRWQDCYDLSNQINAGFGVRLAPGRYSSPGYLVTTWLAFEQLLVAAVRIGVRQGLVKYHPQFVLGSRADGSPVGVTPDLLVRRSDGRTTLLDAKYKGRAYRSTRVSPADLYEALAFAEAAGQQSVTLVYPEPLADGIVEPVGSVHVLDEITVGSRKVTAVRVECRGISQTGGFLAFARGLASLV